MPSFSQMAQVNSTDPLDGGLGARKPRPDEIAKRDAEITAKQAAERRAHDFEKVVHATEKQMRQEAVGEAGGRASGSAPLGNPTKLKECGTGQKLDERGYLVQAAAADRIWPDDFKREIADEGCNILGVFCDHFGLDIPEETVELSAGYSGVTPRQFLASIRYDEPARNMNATWFKHAHTGAWFFYYKRA